MKWVTTAQSGSPQNRPILGEYSKVVKGRSNQDDFISLLNDQDNKSPSDRNPGTRKLRRQRGLGSIRIRGSGFGI